MGQQQILLVVLVTILIGIASVVAMQLGNSFLQNTNLTEVREDVQSIASSSNGYYRKPSVIGGGGSDYSSITFQNIVFPKSGYSSDSLTTYNENGTYVITSRSMNQFTVKAYPSSDESYDENNPLTSTNGEELVAKITPEGFTWQ